MKESDLYDPLKLFLETQSFTVKGEVNHCDVVAIGEDDIPLIVELKLSLNLSLILQAVDRLAITPKVYIGIPKSCKTFTKNRKRMLKLLRMLRIGLITIDTKSTPSKVKLVIEPKDYVPRPAKRRQARLLKEFKQREGDPNKGGVAMSEGVMTAYRQQAINIAHYLDQNGASKASQIAMALKQPKARDILYRNVYGWFEKTGFGIYQLSSLGKQLNAKK